MRKIQEKPLAFLVRVGSANLPIGLWFVLMNLLTRCIIVGHEIRTNNAQAGRPQSIEAFGLDGGRA